ncbi:hypothetical protein KAZ66_03315 [Candidatus Woesebacteria bacterium]|nr:hypothetical protein [Candidatus Woesebacteria bacterium]
MVNAELIDYIKKAKVAGKKDKEISDTLLQLGWGQIDVYDSLHAVSPSPLRWVKEHWKLVAAWLLILVLILIIIGMVYIILTTPPQK